MNPDVIPVGVPMQYDDAEEESKVDNQPPATSVVLPNEYTAH